MYVCIYICCVFPIGSSSTALRVMATTTKHGHETDLEMSPGPLGTTIFEEIYIRIMGK